MKPWIPLALLSVLSLACGGSAPVAASEPVEEPTLPPDEEGIPPEWEHLEAHTSRGESLSGWDGSVEGQKTLWHDNGVKQGEGEFKQYKKTGPWIFWYPSGQKRWEGTFLEDLEEGEERAWYENGELQYEGSASKGLREGVYSFYYETGQLWWRGTYVKGKKHGEFEYFRPDGKRDSKLCGVYANGKLVSG